MTTLEANYRRLLRLFPGDWRALDEDEVVGMLLDGAEPGRSSVPLAETVDLVCCAMVLQCRAVFARGVDPVRRTA